MIYDSGQVSLEHPLLSWYPSHSLSFMISAGREWGKFIADRGRLLRTGVDALVSVVFGSEFMVRDLGQERIGSARVCQKWSAGAKEEGR